MAKDNITPAPFNPATASLEEIQRQAALLDLAEKLERKKAKEDSINQLKMVRVASAKAVNEERARKIAAQEFCNHRKEDNKTALVGTRDSHGETHFTCQRCEKSEFTLEEVSTKGLLPKREQIGGPIVGYIG
jgi:hypothetical protein